MEYDEQQELEMQHRRHDDNNGMHNHHRQRTLTDADVSALISAIAAHDTLFHKSCRFRELDPEILGEAAEFYRKFNSMLDESGKIIWKTVLVAGVSGLILIIGLGFVSKIKEVTGALEP